MEELEMYHGSISKSQAEELLGLDGRDGSFLIRDSETVPNTYCICVLYNQYVFTYRLFQIEGNLWKTETAPGMKERLFRKLRNLIKAFQYPDQGIAGPLLYPVNTKQPHYYHPDHPDHHPLQQQHIRIPKARPQKLKNSQEL